MIISNKELIYQLQQEIYAKIDYWKILKLDLIDCEINDFDFLLNNLLLQYDIFTQTINLINEYKKIVGK